MTILTVVGARPQFIKAAAVSRVVSREAVHEVLVHTGQHYDDNMSAVFFKELEIPAPDHHLGIGSNHHGAQTGRMLEAIETVLLQEKPDWVLVYGDTNSTLAGALAGAKLHIPVAHVEAGLRSFNRRMPEEINRVLTDHVSARLFAPTVTAVTNLTREGIPTDQIFLVGDVMYDAALYYGAKAERQSTILHQLGLTSKSYILATVHRAENTDDRVRLRHILNGFSAVSETMPVVLPLHPRTKRRIEQEGMRDEMSKGVRLIDPVGYLDMVMLEKHAYRIATDSGGVQKEAFFYRVPCVTLRDETEWVELVDLGWNRVVPPIDAESIRQALLESGNGTERQGPADLYGGGRASEEIVSCLQSL
ncbi:MAG: non-hydrolyzing UDP-N-acetylglucosamine 2-epimerase [Nitrospiraceae bacterium]